MRSCFRTVVLAFAVIIILFFQPVQASEQVINGDFETGNLTGWQTVSTGTGSFTVASAYKYSGSYGLRIYSSPICNHYIKQTIDMTDVSTIYLRFYRYDITSPSKTTIGIIGNIPSHYIYYNSSSGYELIEWDASSYTGNQVFFISAYAANGGGVSDIYVDDISGMSVNKLTGFVNNTLGNVVSAATITLDNSGGSTTSNDTGYYEIADITSGTYTITATSPTHEDYSDTVSITSDTEKNITMTRLTPILTWTDKQTTQNDVYLKWRRNMVVDSIKIFKDTDSNLLTTAPAGSYLTGMYTDSNLACDKGIVYWLQPMDGSTAGPKYRIDAKTLPCDGGGGGSVAPDPTPTDTIIPGPTPPPYTNITPEEWLNMTLEEKQELLINITAELPPIIPPAWLEIKWTDLWSWILLLLIIICAAISIDSVTVQKISRGIGLIMVIPGVYFASLAGFLII